MIGISTLGPTPEQVPEYLKPLLDFAMEIVPSSELPHTPIYLMATAGMRLLPEDQQRGVLNAVCSLIQKDYAFQMDNCAEQVRIITGQEEGLYGWVAVNYLMGGFDTSKKNSGTFGFLDMGGASAQIAFEPNAEESSKHANDLIKTRFRNIDGSEFEHNVFVTTWLGYGANQARQRYIQAQIDKYVRENGPPPQEPAPGTNEKPVTLLVDPCLPKDLVLSDQSHVGYDLRGTGDFAQCLALTEPLLNKNAPCPDEPCLFDGVHVPKIDFDYNHFIGVSEYWYSAQDIFGLGGLYNFEEFEKHASTFCSRKWSDLQEDFSGGKAFGPTVDLAQLEMQCFKAAWVSNVLHAGIGIPRLTDPNSAIGGIDKQAGKDAVDNAKDLGWVPPFQSVDSINDVQVSWTLGKMVVHSSQTVPIGGARIEDAGGLSGTDYDILPKRPSGNHFVLFLGILLLIIGIYLGRRGLLRRVKDYWPGRRDGPIDYSRLEGGQFSNASSPTFARTFHEGLNRVTLPLWLLVSRVSNTVKGVRSKRNRGSFLPLTVTTSFDRWSQHLSPDPGDDPYSNAGMRRTLSSPAVVTMQDFDDDDVDHSDPINNFGPSSQPTSRSASPAGRPIPSSTRSTPPRRSKILPHSATQSHFPYSSNSAALLASASKHNKRFSGDSWSTIGPNGKELAFSSTSALSSPSLNAIDENKQLGASPSTGLSRSTSSTNLTKLRNVTRSDDSV